MNRLARWLILTGVTSIVLILTAVLMIAASPAVAATPRIEPQTGTTAALAPDLAKALATAAPDQRLNVIVEMREQVNLAVLAAGQANDPATARQHMVNAMQSTSEHTQAEVRTYLATRWLAGDVERVTPFWIFNGLAVNGARPDVVRALAARTDVGLIRLDHWRHWIDAPPTIDNQEATRDMPVEWGIERIRADEVWSSLGISGTGVVVANLDSGVDWQHPALQTNYRGYDPKGFHQHEGNWFDATSSGALYPVDGHGHGSHTMGTMVGSGGLGVAPGARWIAVRAFDKNGSAPDSWIHAGFQWLLAPDGDPGLAPQVVNNSWGNRIGAVTTFQSDVDALRAAGIFVIFSAGNDGPESGTVGSPASLPGAFAVGAIDQDDEVASFSSRGPSPWGEIRPHVAAPGVNVYSTLPGGTYGDKQGTSMAAPHVAGTVALMLSARPDLSITQTAFILTSTAAPLGDVVPNNDTGFGRVDAYATVALAAKAGLISGTVGSGGQSLPGATIQATPAVSGLHGLATSDQEGHYLLFLGAGYYDLNASAFGHAPASAHAIPVVTATVTTYDFDLTPLPKGHVQGTATADDGKPVDAVISVLGTPITTAATSGDYHLALPGGEHTLKARALGYRVMTASVIVTAGQTSYHNFVLSDSMRVLLVNSGPWYYENEVSYYREALDGLSYAYDERSIKHLPDDTPNFTELLPYDLVIWSSPSDSPRLVGAGEVLTDYLHSGGNLLLSGQDVGFWDGGGSLYFHPYYFDFLHSAFRSDNAPSRQVVCLNEGALGAITLTIQGAGGANNQRWPDEISVLQPDHASLACNYNEGQGAVIQAGFCSAYRALNLGFGFEGINDVDDRVDFMGRALDWFASPRQQVGIELLGQTDPVQVAPPGHTVTHTFQLRNLGEAGAGDAIQLQVSGDEWPATLLTPTVDLSPCAKTEIDLRVEIPPDATWDAFDALTLTVRSSVSATVSQSVVLTSKVPAPVLLVDDDRWYDQEQKYEDALNAARLPYDRWEVKGFFGAGSPPAEVMGWYPVVLWFNGYDWFDPIHPSELPRLTDYLEGGGRLFLSSQEYLYTIGPVTLTRDYFGVIDYSEVLSQTRVRGVPGHVLGDGLGPVNLSYPFKNWSDSVLPAPGTQVAFRGQHGQPAAVTREGTCAASPETCRWRSAFFAFPFETFPEETRTILISRLVGWLSWLGRSSFQADPVIARVNETISYTLTLHNDGPEVVSAVTVSNTLPSSTTLVAGPDGGASYDSPNRRIAWSGDLAPGEVVTITYQLSLTGHTAHDTLRNTADIVLGEQGLHFQRQASVRIAAPDLSGSEIAMSPWDVSQSHGDATQSHGDATQSHGDATQSQGDATQSQGDVSQTPMAAKASTEVLATLILRNDGLDDAPNVTVDNPLPWPLRLVTGTLSSGGAGLATEMTRENRILWEGALAVGAPVTLTYRAIAPPVLKEATWLYNALRLDDGLGGAWEQGGWLYVKPHRFYFPITTKSR